MRSEARKLVLEILKEELQLDSSVPDDFNGLPVRLGNQTFFFNYEVACQMTEFWDDGLIAFPTKLVI